MSEIVSSGSTSLFTGDVYSISTNIETLNGDIRVKNVSCDELSYIILNHIHPKEESEVGGGEADDINTLPSDSIHPIESVLSPIECGTGQKENCQNTYWETLDSSRYQTTDSIFYRSIVLDDNRNILCYSPPNGVSIETLFQQYDTCPDDICVNEIIEGTMVNLFYDSRKNGGNGGWEISTRSNVQCNNWYYRTEYNNVTPTQMTFQQMFFDCFGRDIRKIEDITFFNELNKNYCYSFVMQHPNNHIVLYHQIPTIYLVSIYENLGENKVRFISPNEFEAWDMFMDMPIYFPTRVPYEKKAEDYKIKYCNLGSMYTFLGFMFTNVKTGERAALSNPIYEDVKALRGNNPNLQYHYFTLVKSNQVERFLYFFPNYTDIFVIFHRKYQEFITCVHKCYFSYYVKKENIPIRKDFFIHVSRIHHQIYLPAMASGNKKIITRNVVCQYFDNLSPSAIVYALKHEIRYLQQLKEQDEEKYNSVVTEKTLL